MAAVKFNSKCSTCGTAVAKGTGDVRKGADTKWVVTCDAHKPVRMARNPRSPQSYPAPRRTRMTDGNVTAFFDDDDVYDARKDGFYAV